MAGLGTRFLPATKAQPKEMLPVVDKPLIQYAVEEAYAAGIRHMIFVTGRNKRAIEDHFDTSYELENELEMSNKQGLLAVVRSVTPDDMNFSYVRQPRSLGLGHAVLCAEHMVGNEAFAVLLADDLMVGPPNGDSVLAQMVKQFDELQQSILAVQEVPAEHTRRYGIVAGSMVSPGMMKIRAMVEKPAPEVAPSRMGVAGRYVLTPAVFECSVRRSTSTCASPSPRTGSATRSSSRSSASSSAPSPRVRRRGRGGTARARTVLAVGARRGPRGVSSLSDA